VPGIGFGATATCGNLMSKWEQADVERVKTAAKNGEFMIAEFDGVTLLKRFTVKLKYQENLGL
jgi:hypothetical protein